MNQVKCGKCVNGRVKPKFETLVTTVVEAAHMLPPLSEILAMNRAAAEAAALTAMTDTELPF